MQLKFFHRNSFKLKKLGSDKKKVRVEDIARALNISPSSVSRALNDHPRISDETKNKVKQMALQLGYHTGLPELMHPEKAAGVGVIVPSLEDEVYREVVSGISDHLHENGYYAFILDTKRNPEVARSFFRTHRKYALSGIIHLACHRKFGGNYEDLRKENTAVVAVYAPDNTHEISLVLPDIYVGVYQVIQYFKTLGLQRTALILQDKNLPEDVLIAQSFQEVYDFFEMNRSDAQIVYSGYKKGKVTENLTSLLNRKNRPEALLVKGIQTALEITGFLERQGIKVPDDLLLVAIGPDENSTLSGNLALLKVQGYEMGYEAAELLLSQMKNKEVKKEFTILPTTFVLKSSAIRVK